jgi:nicotinamidase-related amidase
MEGPRLPELRALGDDTLHVVVDMQRIFAEPTPWQVHGLERLLQPIGMLAAHRPNSTVFTRFVTPRTPSEAPGEWQRYFERWRELTLDRMDPAMLEIVPELARFVPPAEVIDKRSYGGMESPGFLHGLQRRRADTLVLSGVETEVCILSIALQAIDRGWRVVVVEDAVASSAPAGHEAAMRLFTTRFGCQVEVASAATVRAAWP